MEVPPSLITSTKETRASPIETKRCAISLNLGIFGSSCFCLPAPIVNWLSEF